jgi:aldose 1-epimerase
MVFTGDALPEGERRRSIAVEPMTCAPNAFVSGDGLVVLDPGETHTAAWGIAPPAAA